VNKFLLECLVGANKTLLIGLAERKAAILKELL